MTIRLVPIILAAALWFMLGQVVQAQEQPRQGKQHQRRYHPDRYDPDRKECDRPMRLRELRRIFHPAPEDFGPIRPNEHEELREFAREQMPRMYRILERLEHRRPQAFRKNLPKLLPQLRHLRRLHEHNPDMAILVGRHAENLFHTQMLRRAWEHASDDKRAHIEQQLRRHVADNITVRTDALLLWADQLETARETHLAERLALLTQEEVDLAEEAPEVREQVRVFWSLDSEARRREARDNLAASLATQLDREIAGMRKRARAMKAAAEQDVDRQVQRILEGRGHRRHRP